MAGTGGARAGAGRPKGLPNKDKRQLISRASEEGIMPLDLLLKDMRFFHELAQQQITKCEETPPGAKQAKAFRAAIELKEKACSRARDAAPYLHPKLSNIQANVNIQEHEARLADFRDDDEA